ncbi:MAG: NAD-dependent epimerase/dehydratase family protein [Bacteroidales bacterium]|nr:NAD-dependent epimerase/dehydratase family protein [Bacteroidales bacterium]
MNHALITGITGQDGAYLAKFLLEKGYRVYGTYRRLSTPNFWRLQYLDIFDRIELLPVDLLDSYSIIESIKIARPDEIYNLGAMSFVGASFEQPLASAEITGIGVVRFLEAIRTIAPDVKFYQASTSEMFGDNDFSEQSETTPFAPSSPYAAAKLYAHNMVRIYRKGYGIFACNGILFNHESPLRGLEFVTRKITNGIAKISLGLEDIIELGNIDAKRDWGYAPEYVEAMWLMMQQEEPDDYVIATNETHTIKEFLQKTFEIVGLDWEKHIKIDKRFIRPVDVHFLKGDYMKSQNRLGWMPKTRFGDLAQLMLKSDIERWNRWSHGEHFPWDAWNYPNEKKILSRKLKFDR